MGVNRNREWIPEDLKKPQMLNYYEILGVAQTATADEIKTAYRKIQKMYHPDVYKGDDPEKAGEMIRLANEAYEVLSNPEKKAEYDMRLRVGYQSPYQNSSYSNSYNNSYSSPDQGSCYREESSGPFYYRTYYYNQPDSANEDPENNRPRYTYNTGCRPGCVTILAMFFISMLISRLFGIFFFFI